MDDESVKHKQRRSPGSVMRLHHDEFESPNHLEFASKTVHTDFEATATCISAQSKLDGRAN